MKYQRKQLIGTGAYGKVFTGFPNDSHDPVAIKEFSSFTHDIPSRIIREINVIASVSHPNIACYICTEINSNSISIVLEYGGVTMNRFIANNDSENRIKYFNEIFGGCLSALVYLHGVQIMHRDIKPDNILIKKKNDEVLVKLCDFSLSKKIQPYRTQRHSYDISTPVYKAPELFSGVHRDYNFSPDVWSLGCTAWEYIHDKFLFNGKTEIAVIQDILKKIPVDEKSMKAAGIDFIPIYDCNTSRVFRFPKSRIACPNNIGLLVEKMLTLNPRNRLSSAKLMEMIGNEKFVEIAKKSKKNHITRKYCMYFNMRRVKLGIAEIQQRNKIISKILEIKSAEKLNYQTAAIAVEVIDRLFENDFTMKENQLNTIAVSCVFIASKFVDFKPMEIFSNLEKIVKMERLIFDSVGIDRLHSPTVLDVYKAATKQKNITDTEFQTIIDYIRCHDNLVGKNAKELGAGIVNFMNFTG